MNSGAKISLAIGGVLSVLSIVLMVVGGAQMGGSVESVDFSSDEVVYKGTEGGSFSSEGPLYSFSVFAAGSNETVDCETVADEIGITNSTSGEDLFIADCESDFLDEDDRTFLGWVINGADDFTVNETTSLIFVTKSGLSGGDIEGFFSGAFIALLASVGLCCGILILLIGVIIALTSKSSQPSPQLQVVGSDIHQTPPSN